MKYKTLLIFGAPGSGKGTQGVSLGSIPRFFHCACGDAFRAIDTRTDVGKAFLEYSSRGELVPDDLTVRMWQENIDRSVASGGFKPDLDYLVLDGIPRNVAQAKLMESRIDVRRVFHLTCPDRAELVRRLKKRALKDNRLDDANESVIHHRLTTYENESKPILDFYGPSRVSVLDASRTPVEVLNSLTSAVIEMEHPART